ncbi:hypothetical protein SAMN05661010_00984 [Modicisalibacter muralis]|uniref:DUF6708 domain-containing protein n=1 Tax=Modicisalibacter muralis TaxID=119000 RepID=A0A1G9HZB6_9GAMM|nr:DUF6708 domain-containing protein [Halomonas muralis]SDL18337.1 hypothetical protein SAMN05661010_00984 [Halomonas muralis]
MQSIRTFFADLSQRLGLADEVITLSPKRRAANKPFQLGDVQEQNAVYLDLATGAEFSKGGLTGILALGTFYTILLLSNLLFEGAEKVETFLMAVGTISGLTFASFLIEVLLPFPMPLRFNRRTREVYFQDKGKLYHVPWDEAIAWMQQTRQVTQYTGATRMTLLQLLMQRFRQPREVIAMQLSIPLGKTPEIQGMLWEYLRCYMEKGPWFDAQGEPLKESNRGEILASRTGKKADLRGAWESSKEARAKGLESVGFTVFFMAFIILFYPSMIVQDWTTAVARWRCEKRQWDALVRERSRPNGPTTRLYDLELAEGLHDGLETQANPAETTS